MELMVRPPVDMTYGDPTLFLNNRGNWAVPLGGTGTGTPIKPGDIVGGGGAFDTYFQ
jgi:hypothetical protein